ncbi:hypothetical protein [Streptomyces sp. NPDC017993]|uniref:hypothetical protein n=1 Tax=Streptomyces sp. NPDC017993 TaxID=3365027 RepID=UPI0037BD02A3
MRAVAVFGLVVVALTGARHSHGGGCGSSHSSSSSSSSSGGYSSSNGGYSSSGNTTSSGTTGSPTAGATTPPESDISITDCKVDSAAGTLSARLSVRNGNSTSSASYNGTVDFTDGTGRTFGTAMISSLRVSAGQTLPTTVTGTFIKSADQQPTAGKCKLGRVFKINS